MTDTAENAKGLHDTQHQKQWKLERQS